MKGDDDVVNKMDSLSQKQIQAIMGISSAIVFLVCLIILLAKQDIISGHFGSYALVGLASGAAMFFLLSGLDQLDLRRFVHDRQDFARASETVKNQSLENITAPTPPLFVTPRLLLIIIFLVINFDSRVLFQSFELIFLWTAGFFIGTAIAAHISSYRFFALRRKIQESNKITHLMVEQDSRE